VIADGDRPRVRIPRDSNRQVRVVLEQRGVTHRLEAELVTRIRGVRHQLAEEYFLVAVQRVDHQVEELCHLRLEAECFPCSSCLCLHDSILSSSVARSGIGIHAATTCVTAAAENRLVARAWYR